jgi:hypothetical protein
MIAAMPMPEVMARLELYDYAKKHSDANGVWRAVDLIEWAREHPTSALHAWLDWNGTEDDRTNQIDRLVLAEARPVTATRQ